MRTLSFAIALATGLAPLAAAAATPAPAPAGGSAADARCLMTMAALASSQDENSARLGQAGVVFFAGRIKAQDPTYDLGARLKAVAQSMNGENIQAEAQRCGPMVIETLNQLQTAQKSFGSTPPPATQTPPKK